VDRETDREDADDERDPTAEDDLCVGAADRVAAGREDWDLADLWPSASGARSNRDATAAVPIVNPLKIMYASWDGTVRLAQIRCPASKSA